MPIDFYNTHVVYFMFWFVFGFYSESGGFCFVFFLKVIMAAGDDWDAEKMWVLFFLGLTGCSCHCHDHGFLDFSFFCLLFCFMVLIVSIIIYCLNLCLFDLGDKGWTFTCTITWWRRICMRLLYFSEKRPVFPTTQLVWALSFSFFSLMSLFSCNIYSFI